MEGSSWKIWPKNESSGKGSPLQSLGIQRGLRQGKQSGESGGVDPLETS